MSSQINFCLNTSLSARYFPLLISGRHFRGKAPLISVHIFTNETRTVWFLGDEHLYFRAETIFSHSKEGGGEGGARKLLSQYEFERRLLYFKRAKMPAKSNGKQLVVKFFSLELLKRFYIFSLTALAVAKLLRDRYKNKI